MKNKSTSHKLVFVWETGSSWILAKNDPSSALLKRFYPEFGTGGIQQLRVDSVLRFDNVIILRD